MTNLIAFTATNKLLITATNKFLVTAAYKYVAMAIMLTNCNLFAQQIHLPLDQPITQKAKAFQGHVTPPRLIGFSGSVETDKYFFGFGRGHLANFWQRKFRAPSSSQGIREQQARWAKMASPIGTNEAHALAINWLTDLGVDAAKLERKYPCKITQRFFYSPAADSSGALAAQKRVPLPIFQIQWGSIPIRGHGPEYNYPAITMTVFGPTQELIEYHLLDDSLMLRSKLLDAKGVEKLLAIRNQDFDRFTEIQRSDLISQFVRKK